MRKCSFTIIELVVTIAVIGILSGWILTTSFYNFTESKKLEIATKKFVQILEIAKKKATVGDKPSTCSGFTAYKVSYGLGSFTDIYRALAQCSVDIQDGPDYVISPNYHNIIFTASGNILFNPLGLGVSLNPAVSCINIKNNRINKCFKITIEKSGVIEDQKDDNCSC